MRLLAAILALLHCVVSPALARERPPLVLAASSMQEALGEIARVWAARGHPRPVLSFAASSALARQIGQGAPADLFLSADSAWMDYLQAKGKLAPRSRTDLVGNRLVLIAPVGSRVRLRIGPGFPLARALGKERLAMADPDAVPAGKYARAALIRLGVWARVSGRIAHAENVRAALKLVERGEAPLGIVYATDARASSRIRVVGVFPASSHPPIRYPLARLATATNPQGEAFRRFLTSPTAAAIFARHGFTVR